MDPFQTKSCDFHQTIVGSWSWSGQYKTIPNKIVDELIDNSLNHGFYEFDTSPTYGKAENILAKYKRRNSKILINTKCGWNKDLKKSFEPKNLIEGIDISLEKFEKINVMQLHNPRNEIRNWDEIIEILNIYKKKKLIKKIGISLARNFYFPNKILNKFDFIV